MKLEKYLNTTGITLTRLSHLTGIPLDVLSRYKAGVYRPSVINLFKLDYITDGEVSVGDWIDEFRKTNILRDLEDRENRYSKRDKRGV